MALSSDCRVTISEDRMSALLYLTPPLDGVPYTVEEVTDFVRHNGVNNGIIFQNISDMLSNNVYYYEYIVAKGAEVVHGIPGYYDFYFDDSNVKKKPQIRSDGSVDYQSMNAVKSVKVGEKLAVYHPAVQGKHGYDVSGREFRAKPGKELPKLHGTGFEVSYDGLTYTATTDGKVEYDNYKLYVKDVYEFKGDLDLIVGKIDFRGDVIIYGNVCAGTTIRATKSITVEGAVEAATLIADGDIILKKGMHGGKRARVVSGGNVYANFIEFTTVEAKGNVEANIILNSIVTAGRAVIVSGRRGSIVGGSSRGTSTIKSTFLGNAAGIKTIASVGLAPETERRNHLLSVKAESTKVSLAKTIFEIKKLKASGLIGETKEVREAKLSQLERKRVRDERLLLHIEEEQGKITEDIRLAQSSRILVDNTAHHAGIIRIDDKEKVLMEDVKHAEFLRNLQTNEIIINPMK